MKRGYAVTDCYYQRTNYEGGFSLDNFKAEIDAGHPVMINLKGHTIVGYGYDGTTIYIRDTWDSDPSHTYTMTWGGSYQGMAMQAVSVVHPAATPAVQLESPPAMEHIRTRFESPGTRALAPTIIWCLETPAIPTRMKSC